MADDHGGIGIQMMMGKPLPQSVLVEDAFAVALAREQVGSYCNQCLMKGEKLKRCSACKMMVYCSPSCQQADWKQHKSECESIKKHDGIADDGIRLVMRLAYCYTNGILGEVVNEYVPGGRRSLETLEDHSDELEEEANKFLTDYKQFAVRVIAPDEIIKLMYKKVSINSFGVSNQFGSLIGVALCIKLSTANHSCLPSTRVTFKNRRAMLMPTGQMPVTLESAAHSYIDELQPRGVRRKILKEKYKFDCMCVGCADKIRNEKMEGFSCCICVDGWMPNKEGSKCKMCKGKMTADHYSLCRVAEEAAISGKPTVVCDSIPLGNRVELCVKLMDLFKDTLHKNNVHRLPVLRVLYGASLFNKDIESAERYGIELLEIMSEYQSETDMAILYHKYGLAQVMLAGGAKESARELLEAIAVPYAHAFGSETQVVHNINVMLKSTEPDVETKEEVE